MKQVYKYATGVEIPEGAIFLSTKVEEVEEHLCPFCSYSNKNCICKPNSGGGSGGGPLRTKKVRYVWHYFLIETN